MDSAVPALVFLAIPLSLCTTNTQYAVEAALIAESLHPPAAL